MLATINRLLSDCLENPPAFNAEGWKQLLDVTDNLRRIATLMANSAIDADCGDVVGSPTPDGFFTDYLKMSTRDTRRLLRRVELWKSHPQLATSELTVEKQDIILSALGKLDHKADESELISRALAFDPAIGPDQFRRRIKELTWDINRTHATELGVGERRRSFTMSEPDEHGGASFSGYAPARVAAVLAANIDRAFNGHAGLSEEFEPDDDQRSISQRRADAFADLVMRADAHRTKSNGQCSLVVSMTKEDFDDVDWDAAYATNTGFRLTPLDIARLARGVEDYFVIHDQTGSVIELRTANRFASFEMKVALLATQRVCQHPGCDMPASRCDVHHMLSWLQGGGTDVENLALLCRRHHTWNDDSRSKPHRGYIHRHLESGTIGRTFNNCFVPHHDAGTCHPPPRTSAS